MSPLFEIISRLPAWEGIALRHGLAGWMSEELALAGEPVPAALAVAARAQFAQGAKLKRLTLAVLDALAAVDVVPVLLKGYGLASRLFPSQPFARPATDVDVLVRPDSVPQAERALARLGLEKGTVPGVEEVFEEHHHAPWAGPGGLVELHFRLFTGFGGGHFDDRALWARSVAGTLDGRAVRWLAPEDEFLYLAVHAANHAFLRVSWLWDLERFLHFAPTLDWGIIAARAHAAGFVVPMTTTLHLLETMCGVTLPEAARKAFDSAPLRRRIDGRVFSARRVLDARWSEHRVASFALRLYLADSPARGLKHLVEGVRRLVRQRLVG